MPDGRMGLQARLVNKDGCRMGLPARLGFKKTGLETHPTKFSLRKSLARNLFGLWFGSERCLQAF